MISVDVNFLKENTKTVLKNLAMERDEGVFATTEFCKALNHVFSCKYVKYVADRDEFKHMLVLGRLMTSITYIEEDELGEK